LNHNIKKICSAAAVPLPLELSPVLDVPPVEQPANTIPQTATTPYPHFFFILPTPYENPKFSELLQNSECK